MKSFGDLYKSKKTTSKKTSSNEEIINQAILLHLQGNIKEAEKYYQQIINKGCSDDRVFSNYSVILQSQGELNKAELSSRTAIAINPKNANAYLNLGNILKDYGKLQEAIENQICQLKLQPVKSFVEKVIQVHETQLVRHGMMVVGEAGSGKSVNVLVLSNALGQLQEEGVVDKDDFFRKVTTDRLNPKAITAGQLYGEFNLMTGEWFDGLVPNLVRRAKADKRGNRHWILFDGPVDAVFNSIKKVFPHSAKLQHFQIHAVTEGTDAQATVSVRLEESGKIVTGQSSDTDTVVASAKAYINSLNKLILRRQKKAPKAIAN